MTVADGLLRVSAVAKRASLPARTVRFYADTGLLRPAARADNGYRLFGADAVERAQLLRRATRLGVPLREIAQVLRVAESSDCTDAHLAFAHALRARILEVDRQVKELASIREQLVDLAAESDVGCSDAFCLCRTKPGGLVPLRWGKR
ncbi:MAG TPA: MerR family transcriptional regulator [Candidatus Limnocylindria bacterium]|nr:MerR family transcriptional regulator [Candidatus Limnocylindria bacterium]